MDCDWPGGGEVALGAALVEEFAFSGVVAAEDDLVAPAGEVADDLEVIGAWGEAGGVGGVEIFREAPEGAMHRHEQIGFADVADAGPLGVPTVRAVVRMRGFREAVAVPRAMVEDLENERAEIPADGPERIGGGIFVAGEAAGAGNFGELVAADDGPRGVMAVPGREDAGGDVGVDLGFFAVFAVVGVNEDALAGVKAFAVVAGEVGLAAVRELFVAPEFGDGEGVNVHFVEAFFHRGGVNFVGGIGEVAGVAGGAAEHFFVGNRAHGAFRVDGVGADEELLRLGVDKAIRGRAADAFRVNRLAQSGVDGVEFVVGALGLMRRVGDDPEFVRPWNDGARAAQIGRAHV